MNWSLPENVSTFGAQVDSIYYLILGITAVIFFAVEALLVYFLVRYRHREGRKAAYIHGNTRAEVIWTLVPFLIILFIAFRSRTVWLEVKDPERMPPGALELRVAAKQFEWNVTYPGPDERLGTADDFVRRGQLRIPVNRPVRVTLASEDVIHSFFLPEFRVKQDAVPGMEIPVWFQATRTGEFTLGCAELCGLGHYRMRGTVTVQTAEEFAAWQREQSRAGLAAAN
ncbi:MAG TPA: cytochrome c oxidase subunit II [Longimicrobiales bacterium]